MADIFISYSKTDRTLIEKVAQVLTDDGYSVWWDTNLTSGEIFREVIDHELETAGVVIVIWSTTSVKSRWVIAEADDGDRMGKLIPIRTADLEPWQIPKPFNTAHTDIVENRAAILAAVARHLERQPPNVPNNTHATISNTSSISRPADEFESESPLAQKIILDHPPYWEYRLTAELLQRYLKHPLQKWRAISTGLYSNPGTILHEEEVLAWFREQIGTVTNMMGPIGKLISIELARAWGKPGNPGDAHEIQYVCRLIERAAKQAVDWEEHVHFISVPEQFEALYRLLPGLIGTQIEKLEGIPKTLNEGADWAEAHPDRPRTFEHSIVFDVPDGWECQVNREIKRLEQLSWWS